MSSRTGQDLDPRTGVEPVFYAASADGDLIDESQSGIVILVKNTTGTAITLTLQPTSPTAYVEAAVDMGGAPDGPFYGLPAGAYEMEIPANSTTFIGPLAGARWHVITEYELIDPAPVYRPIRASGYGIGLAYSDATGILIALMDAFHTLH